MSPAAPRIVSLLPSATEFVALLGLQGALVGRSHECDAPPGIETLPECTRSLIPDGASAEIDASVRERLARGAPLYEIAAERVRALAPTHILTQAQCDVCAIGEEQVQALIATWPEAARPQIVALSPHTLGDVFSDLKTMGRALDVPERARAAASALGERLASVGETIGGEREQPTVLCLEWLDPPIAAGNWMPEIVALAGGRALFASVGEPSRDVAWSDIAAADPDFILVMPCGFDRERTLREARELENVPQWRALGARKTGRVYAVDANAYFNRSGPRLVDSTELLAELMWPARFGEPRYTQANAPIRIAEATGVLKV